MKDLLINIGKLKPLYRWGGLGGVVLIIVLVYYFAVYLPHQNTMSELVKDFGAKKEEFSKMAVVVRDKAIYQEEVENLDRELRIAKSVLPEKKEIPSLLKKLSEEAEKFTLEVYYFEPSPEVIKGFYAEVPVSIKLKGSFHEILSFFDSVNKLARIVNASNIQMKAEPEQMNKPEKVSNVKAANAFSAFQPNKTKLDVSFTATTYRFLSQEEINQNQQGGQGVKK